MTSDSATKKAIRERMAETGEPYMEARRHVESAGAATTSAGAWIIQQGTSDPRDSVPYEWVLHEDGTTHGFIDHGRLIGVLTEPDDQRGLRPLPKPLTEADVQSMLGGYPVTSDRFTGGWATWTNPIESIEPAPPAGERTRLYGGWRDEPRGSRDHERAALRAEADRRVREDRDRPQGALCVTELHFTNGLTLDVEWGGVTSQGLIEGFVTADSPTAHTAWADVVQALDEGHRDLSRLAGTCLRVYPSDDEGPNQMHSPLISDVIVADAE